jgi:hypothetical protein
MRIRSSLKKRSKYLHKVFSSTKKISRRKPRE